MKKLLLILVLAILCGGVARADDRGELFRAAFKKALQNHLYFFKFENKFYTTNTKEKEFDFFDHGYDYHEASAYMKKNYTVSNGASDGNIGCMLYKGKLHHFRDYLDYDKNGWKKNTIIKSKDGLVTVVLSEAATCPGSNYFKVYFNGAETFDSRPDLKTFINLHHSVWLNINYYIDKDHNLNGKNELFIDAGYSRGIRWDEWYYFFEYDKTSIKLVKSFRAGEGKDPTEMFKGRLNISDHFNKKFTVTEEELIKVITKNFTVN